MGYIKYTENSRPVSDTDISIPQDIFPEFYNICDKTKKNQNILGSRNVQVFSLEMICWLFRNLRGVAAVCISHIAWGLYRGAAMRQDIVHALTECPTSLTCFGFSFSW